MDTPSIFTIITRYTKLSKFMKGDFQPNGSDKDLVEGTYRSL